jgi:hypothetical protein
MLNLLKSKQIICVFNQFLYEYSVKCTKQLIHRFGFDPPQWSHAAIDTEPAGTFKYYQTSLK